MDQRDFAIRWVETKRVEAFERTKGLLQAKYAFDTGFQLMIVAPTGLMTVPS